MADISMELIKELKDKSGAGIVDCKKTLEETDGDIEKAIDILRKKGISKAAKKEGRTAKEGLVILKTDGKKGLAIKVNCETDFVAKTEDFQKFANEVTDIVFSKGYECKAELPADIEELRKAIIGKLGENILIPEWKFIDCKGVLFPYLHLGKVGTIVDFVFDKDISSDTDAQTIMKNVAMQITAMNPVSISAGDVPADVLKREKEIYMEEARNSGKPEQVVEKIADGKLRKFYEENVLLEQSFILDGDKKVSDIINEFAKAKGVKVDVASFVRVGL
jgi:elongation factor Ts